jgi:cation transport protein ChaC
MWQPGFRFEEAYHARLDGYHRAFCVYSVHYRGAPEHPGLVLGLDRGGVCEGMVYRVAGCEAVSVRAYLTARELIYGVYRATRVPVTIVGGSRLRVLALTFVAERRHPSYAGRLGLVEQVRRIRSARGRAGSNMAYLVNTLRHLKELGIRERQIERIAALAGRHREQAEPSGKRAPVRRAAHKSGLAAGPGAWRFRPEQRARFGHRARLERRTWST